MLTIKTYQAIRQILDTNLLKNAFYSIFIVFPHLGWAVGL